MRSSMLHQVAMTADRLPLKDAEEAGARHAAVYLEKYGALFRELEIQRARAVMAFVGPTRAGAQSDIQRLEERYDSGFQRALESAAGSASAAGRRHSRQPRRTGQSRPDRVRSSRLPNDSDE